MAQILNSSPLNISFRQNLVGMNLRDWLKIVVSLQDVNLHEQRDVFIWALHSSRSFSVKSMYAALINNGVRMSQDIWQIKIPTKIKIFLWYLKKGVILIKDNLVRQHWNGDTKCCFCHSPETLLGNIFFWIVFLPDSCGERYIYSSE